MIFWHGALKLPELLLLFVSYLTNLSWNVLGYNRITGSKQCELTALCGDNQEPVNMGFIVFKPMEISSTNNFINKYKIAIIISNERISAPCKENNNLKIIPPQIKYIFFRIALLASGDVCKFRRGQLQSFKYLFLRHASRTYKSCCIGNFSEMCLTLIISVFGCHNIPSLFHHQLPLSKQKNSRLLWWVTVPIANNERNHTVCRKRDTEVFPNQNITLNITKKVYTNIQKSG